MGCACSVWATLGLPPLTACVLSPSTLLRLQVALQRNCLKGALVCMHFPGLGRSGSGSRVLHKGRLGWACILCPSQVRAAQATRCLRSATLQYSCLESSMDRGVWWATVHGVTESQTRLRINTFTFKCHLCPDTKCECGDRKGRGARKAKMN